MLWSWICEEGSGGDYRERRRVRWGIEEEEEEECEEEREGECCGFERVGEREGHAMGLGEICFKAFSLESRVALSLSLCFLSEQFLVITFLGLLSPTFFGLSLITS